MKHVGVICEYNPLHTGHKYMLDRVREGETVICLMSGNFTQRGEAAILPPISRATMALAAGADLVLELPFPFAAGSARYFAAAGVDALARLGADTLAFGSESADVSVLTDAARRVSESDFLEKRANGAKNKGAAAQYFEALGKGRIDSNDILAVEYARAVHETGDRLALYPILRVGAGYHDTDTSAEHPSATALRCALARGEDILRYLPVEIRELWKRETAVYGMADIACLGTAILAVLRAMPGKSFITGAKNTASDIADCGGGLLERLAGAAHTATDYESLCRGAATKKYTNGRIRRALLYLLSGVTYRDLEASPAYLRLLGANERGRAFLAETRKTREIPVVTKQADITALGACAVRQRALAAVSDGLYALCIGGEITPSELAVIPPVVL